MHGCFWHQHAGCRKGALPKSKLDYWLPKLRRNRERDGQAYRELRKLGWGVMVVWQCELAEEKALTRKLRYFLGSCGASI